MTFHHPRGALAFHQWMGGPPSEDSCIGCGVVAPDFGEGVVSDHGALPLMCPGPDVVGNPHHFERADASSTSITCAHCSLTIHHHTDPDSVIWTCGALDVWLRIPEGEEESEAEANTFVTEHGTYDVQWYLTAVGLVTHVPFDTLEEAHAFLARERFEDFTS